MKTRNIVCLFILVLTVSVKLQAQNKLNIVVRNDSVFSDNKFEFFASEKSSNGKTLLMLRSPDSVSQAFLYFIPQGDTALFIGRFGKLNKMYECRYPVVTPAVLYESYIRNGVMVNGVAKLAGLQKYCADRKIDLREIPVRHVEKPGVHESDSILKARADEKMKAMVQIEITNKSAQPVTIMSGMPVRVDAEGHRIYSEKREEVFAAGEKKTFISFKGELICIVLPDKSEKDCKAVDSSLKSLSITTTGDKFGK